jgi:hypothetical protein
MHAQAEPFVNPGGVFRVYCDADHTYEKRSPFIKGNMPYEWVTPTRIEVKGVSANPDDPDTTPITAEVLKALIAEAGRMGAKEIGFVRYRRDGERHEKWFETGIHP